MCFILLFADLSHSDCTGKNVTKLAKTGVKKSDMDERKCEGQEEMKNTQSAI